LLPDNALQPRANGLAKHHVVELGLRIAALDQPLQLAARPRQRDWRLAGRRVAKPFARLLDEALQLVRLFGIALARLLCRNLERYRQKLLFVPSNVRIEQRDDLLG